MKVTGIVLTTIGGIFTVLSFFVLWPLLIVGLILLIIGVPSLIFGITNNKKGTPSNDSHEIPKESVSKHKEEDKETVA